MASCTWIVVQYGDFLDENGYGSWMGFLILSTQFTYITLDAMDGKHARALGMSSPLGCMLDHGCDALTTTCQATFLTSLITRFDTTLFQFAIYLLAQTSFFSCQWAASYEKKLETGGATEAQYGAMIPSLLHMIFGAAIWKNREVGFVVEVILMTLGVIIGCSPVVRVVRRFGIRPILTYLPIIATCALAFYLHSSGVFARRTMACIGCIGITFILSSLRFVVANTIKKEVSGYQLAFPVALLAFGCHIPCLLRFILIGETFWLIFIVMDTIRGACRTLDIPFIVVKTKTTKKEK